MTHRGPFLPLLFCDSVILLLLHLGSHMASDHSVREPTRREGAAHHGSRDREWMCTDAAQWTEVHVGGPQ